MTSPPSKPGLGVAADGADDTGHHDVEFSPSDRNPNRCAVCGWTLADSIKAGCVRGNCSYRPHTPFPREQWYDAARADRERAS
jgi:hypothetical protein